MGQSASSPSVPPSGSAAPPSRRSSVFWRRSSPRQSDSAQTVGNSIQSHGTARAREAVGAQGRRGDRISDILHQVLPYQSPATTRIRRSRRNTSSLVPETTNSRERSLQDLLDENLRNATAPRSPRPDISLPRVDIPATPLDIDFAPNNSSAPQRPASHRSSLRLPNSLSDRLSGFRQNRSVTTTTTNTVLRRRRAPLASSEDNAALLSRLLSVAAATTAQTLLEGTEHSMAEARGTPMEGEDGTWDSFLRSLESGPLSVTLREGAQSWAVGEPAATLNLFRLFRFEPRSQSSEAGAPRMVPIIIVGIRSVVPGVVPEGSEDNLVPTFLEALTTTPINPRTFNQNYNNARRRRASMGGVGSLSTGFDAQRHERPSWRTRPQSVAADMSSWPRPPPATPATPGSFASPESSNDISRATSPLPLADDDAPAFDGPESVIRTTTTTTLETTTQPEPQAAPRPRTGADADNRNSTYNARRNGVVEPDAPNPENTRSWIIYVLGGSYPENHPLLHTPSLFTDSPTYEDMMLLSTLVAPAKPPVASDTDVASAGGIYDIRSVVNDLGQSVLVAVEQNGSASEELTAEQRCLVCLCDLEKDEQARKLADCGHLFHRECIDEWLTKGRNSCPLCRSQGVKKHEKPEAIPVDSVAPTPVIPSDAHMPSIA